MRALYEKIDTPENHSLLCRCFKVDRFSAPWHFHPECELTFIVSSSGLRHVGDSIEPFAEGDLVLLGANTPHFWKNDEAGGKRPRQKACSIVVQFREDFLGVDFWRKPELEPIARLLRLAKRGLKFTGATQKQAGALLQKLVRDNGARQLIGLLSILDILARSRQARPLSSVGFLPALDLFDAERINLVHRHVYARLAEPIYQPQVASLVHMSPASFSRFFRQKTGRTFSAFVNEVRVGRAARLLTEENMNITEACYASGFENLSNFNRRFRAIKSMTPREFAAHFAGVAAGG
jgi:AraC-like DNA-binding protein